MLMKYAMKNKVLMQWKKMDKQTTFISHEQRSSGTEGQSPVNVLLLPREKSSKTLAKVVPITAAESEFSLQNEIKISKL